MPDVKTFYKKTKLFLDDICSEIYDGDMNFEYIEDADIKFSLMAEYTDEHNAKVYINSGVSGRERDIAYMIGAARVWQMRHNFPLLKLKSEFAEDNDAGKLCDMFNAYVHSNHARYIVRSNRMLYTNTYAKNDIKIAEAKIDDMIDIMSQGVGLNRYETSLCVVLLCYLYETADEVKADAIAKNKYISQTDIEELYRRAVKTIENHDCSYRYGCIRFFEAMLFVLGMEDVFEISFYRDNVREV